MHLHCIVPWVPFTNGETSVRDLPLASYGEQPARLAPDLERAGTSAPRAQLPGPTPSREAEHDGAGRGQRGSRDARPGSASTRDPRVTGSGAAASSDRGGRGDPCSVALPTSTAMAWTKYQLFLAGLMLVTGSINTLSAK